MKIPQVSFKHLQRMSDTVGLFEHAELTSPRLEHGYCVDDVARGLMVLARQPDPSAELSTLAAVYLRFIGAAQREDGSFRSRCDVSGEWQDEAGFVDCWGRAILGLGTAVARAPNLASDARVLFDVAVAGRSPHPRAMAFAGLGAAEVLVVEPGDLAARSLLSDAALCVGAPHAGQAWRWTQARLEYANAVLPEVLLAAGSLLDDPQAVADGVAMLRWLCNVEQQNAHLSVTPVGGWVKGDPRPAFDQQPIEVAALADACARAFDLTGDIAWSADVQRCANWFLGDNDVGVPLYDRVSAGGCDGLEAHGRNENQGAESTLSMISTFQQAHRISASRP